MKRRTFLSIEYECLVLFDTYGYKLEYEEKKIEGLA